MHLNKNNITCFPVPSASLTSHRPACKLYDNKIPTCPLSSGLACKWISLAAAPEYKEDEEEEAAAASTGSSAAALSLLF
jgi:hypothetical protein